MSNLQTETERRASMVVKSVNARQLELLVSLSSLINSTLDPHEVRNRTIETIITLLDAEAGSLLLIDENTGELYFEVATGASGEKLKEIRLRKGEGIAGWVAGSGCPLIINDVSSDPRFYRKADEKSGFETKSIVSVPVWSKDRIIGVVEGINKVGGRFTEEDREVLIALSNQVAIAVENARLYEQLKEAFYSTAEALAETIELRDPYTGGHTRRVMTYCLAIGNALGMGKNEIELLKLASILHDIGKIGVADNVLLKQGKLDADEFQKISKHPGYGASLLQHVRHLAGAIPGVRGHHERIDGKGYPDGLAGEEIPRNARIIAVADTFDAMTTDRPYRKGMPAAEAFAELDRCAGTQFDPAVVKVFTEAWAKGDLGT